MESSVAGNAQQKADDRWSQRESENGIMNSSVALTIQKGNATGLFIESQAQGFVVVAFIKTKRLVSIINLIAAHKNGFENLVTQPMYNGHGVVGKNSWRHIR